MIGMRRPALRTTAGLWLVVLRMRQVLHLVPAIRGKTAGLIILGMLAGFSEMVGITLLVSLVFLIGQDASSAVPGGSIPLPFFGDMGATMPKSVLIVVVTMAIIVRIMLAYANQRLASSVGNAITSYVRVLVYDKVLSVTYERAQQYERSDLINLIATETYTVANTHSSIVRVVINLGTIVIFGIGMIITAWPIALLAALFGVVHNQCLGFFANAFRRVGASALDATEALTQLTWGTLQVLKAIKAFGLEERHRQLFRALSTEVGKTQVQSERMSATTSLVSETLVFGIVLAIIITADFLPVDFKATLAATILLYRLQPHIKEFDWQLLRLQELEASVQRIFGVISEHSDPRLLENGASISKLDDGIVFERVSFNYSESIQPVVDGINFRIEAFGSTALVGPSGSGKTTILNLLLDLARPTEGRILIDGRNLATLDHAQWLKMLSISGQDVELMEGTVMDNIRFRREISEEDVRRAADLVEATEFINGLPYGFEEWLGNEAVRLSGGQRQRIGLARAIAGRPRILLLDEATNALDETTEMRVLTNILSEFQDRAVLVVSHRTAVAQRMDRIIRLGSPGAPPDFH